MSLGREILDLVPKSQAKDIVCDIGEAALDTNFDQGFLKDVPLIGTIVRTGSAVVTIRDRIFIKKVSRFLSALRNIPDEQVAKFLTELDNANLRQEVGEKVILLLDKQEDFEKAKLVGVVFERYVAGELNYEDFQKLSHAITSTFVGDLNRIIAAAECPEINDDSFGAALMASGLATLKVKVDDMRWGERQKATNRYQFTRPGQLLARIMKRWQEENVAGL